MKTRRIVQALYDRLGCNFIEEYICTPKGSGVKMSSIAVMRHGAELNACTEGVAKLEKAVGDLAWNIEKVRDGKEAVRATLEALLDHLGLEAQKFGAGVRIVKTTNEIKKAKGTKRA